MSISPPTATTAADVVRDDSDYSLSTARATSITILARLGSSEAISPTYSTPIGRALIAIGSVPLLVV